MKARITVAFALVLALLLSLSFPVFAETGELPTAEEIENSGMADLDELLRLREELAREKAELDRRIAAENGNRRIRLEPASVSVMVGESTVLTASVERADADAPEKTDLVWSVGDTDVAHVSGNGKVTGRKAGSTVVICTARDDPSIFFEAELTVTQNVRSLRLEDYGSNFRLQKGEQRAFSVRISPDDATDRTLSWASSDPAVASVSADGTVTAEGPGTAKITCTAADRGEKSLSFRVFVPTIAIPFDKASVTEKSGLKFSFTHYGNPDDLRITDLNGGPLEVLYDGGHEAADGGIEYNVTILPNCYGVEDVLIRDLGVPDSSVRITFTVEHSAVYDHISYHVLDYEMAMRCPEEIKGSKVLLVGRIKQDINDGSGEGYYVAVLEGEDPENPEPDPRGPCLVYVRDPGVGAYNRFFNTGEYIRVYGVADGLLSYTSIIGAQEDVPVVVAEMICFGANG